MEHNAPVQAGDGSAETKITTTAQGQVLARYEATAAALAELSRVDEVKEIRDQAIALQVYAQQAKDRRLIECATDVRMRAERRAGELLREMEKNQGAVPGKTGSKGRPVLDTTPKLSDLKITKTQSSRWQRFAALDAETFESRVAAARKKATNGLDGVHREIRQKAEREAAYEARIKHGCTVDDLHALAASGYRAGVIYVDVPSRFETWSLEGKLRSPERYYDCEGLAALKAMGSLIRSLAAKDCALFFWTSGALDGQAHEIIREWEFDYATWAFVWIKTLPSIGARTLEELTPADLHKGMGYSTRANVEAVLLATRGSPMRLVNDVQQVVIAPVAEHSAKPEEVRKRIERLYPGPYLELYGRRLVAGWTTWGNELPPPIINGDEAPDDGGAS